MHCSPSNHAILALSNASTPFLPLPLPPLHANLIRPTPLPRAQNQPHNILHPLPVLHHREDRRAPVPHPPRIPLHDLHVRPDRLRQIDLVHHEQVAPRDARPALARHLVPARHVDDVDDEVGQLPAVVCREVVAPALDEQQVGGEAAVQGLQRVQVRADVFAHGGVRAAARFDGLDPCGRQGGAPRQELGVFPREDVVGHGGDAVAVAQGQAEGEHQCGFAGADGSSVRVWVGCQRGGSSFFSSSSFFFQTRARCGNVSLRERGQDVFGVIVKGRGVGSLPADPHREGSFAPVSP